MIKIPELSKLDIKALLEGLEGNLQQGILKENFPYLTVSGFSLSAGRKNWDFCETGTTSPAVSHCFEGKSFPTKSWNGMGEGNTHHFPLGLCVASWVWRLKGEKLEFLNLKNLSFSSWFFFFSLENGDALNCVQAREQMMPGCRVCKVDLVEINFYLHYEIYFILCFEREMLWLSGMYLTLKREAAIFYWVKWTIWQNSVNWIKF